MQFLETRRDLDRKGWPAGPWDDEPDYAYWRDEATELDCLIVRNQTGALCGYVGVPKGHPWHSKGYDEIEGVDVHGGLTYSAGCNTRVCHPADHKLPTHWIGFDCAHAYDVRPGHLAMGIRSSLFDETYRDVSYVVAEVQCLAKQIAEAGK